MGTIKNVASAFKSVDLKSEAPKIVQESEAEMSDLNLAQLEQGLSSDGLAIEPEYRNPFYKPERSNRSPNLKDTGDFHRGWFMKVSSGSFFFGSSDEKSLLLEGKYSKNGSIFGLTKQSIGETAKNIVGPKIFSYIKEKTGLNIK